MTAPSADPMQTFLASLTERELRWLIQGHAADLSARWWTIQAAELTSACERMAELARFLPARKPPQNFNNCFQQQFGNLT